MNFLTVSRVALGIVMVGVSCTLLSLGLLMCIKYDPMNELKIYAFIMTINVLFFNEINRMITFGDSQV
jgi:hypothetical protein